MFKLCIVQQSTCNAYTLSIVNFCPVIFDFHRSMFIPLDVKLP